MGNILWKKRPPSEELDKLVAQIKELEVQLKELLSERSRWLQVIFYGLMFLCTLSNAYCWVKYKSMKSRVLIVLAVGTFTVALYFLLRFVILAAFDYFVRSKRKRIQFFTERKIAIIEDVKENEKFKVAKQIIEKYGSEEEVKQMLGGDVKSDQNTLANELKMSGAYGKSARLAKFDDSDQQTSEALTPRVPKLYEISDNRFTARTPVRPFVEQSQTPVDRILDYVMGESINNRYALICANCRVHNGMALREEFEHISFFCFKCNCYNPSRNELKVKGRREQPTWSLSSAAGPSAASQKRKRQRSGSSFFDFERAISEAEADADVATDLTAEDEDQTQQSNVETDGRRVADGAESVADDFERLTAAELESP